MSTGPVRALPTERVFTWRIALLAFCLLLSTFVLPPFLGLDSPLVPAGAVVNQGNATGCRAYGTNWTSCQTAFLSDDQYAYANASAGSSLIQRVATTTDSADASSWSFSHTVPSGSNRILLLAIATDNGIAVFGTPQYGSTSFALLTTLVHSTGKPRVTLYNLITPTVGTALVTGNLASDNKYTAGAISYTGVHQTMPGDNLTTAEGASGTTMIINVPSEVGDLVVDFTANIGTGLPNVGSGQTEAYNEEMGGSGATNHSATSSEEAGASSVEMRWNGKQSEKEWVSVGLNLNVALSTTGLRSPSATGEDFNQWTTPGNAFSSDDQYAEEDVNGRMQDYYNFSFGVPNGANIAGIEFQVEGHDPDWSGNGILVELSWDGGISYTSTGNFVDLPNGADAGYQTLGGPTNTWGRTWTAGEFSDGNFRTRIEKDGSDLTFSNVDHMRMQVDYTLPPLAERDTVWRGFGFTLDPADEVQVVEVGIEWWRDNAAPTLNVTVSWDGGMTWATNQTATNKSADDDTVEWLDFTSATVWNASKLRDANLRVRVGTDFAGARLDYVTVRTTYNDAPEVSNLRIEDATGQSLAGGLLDPAAAYHVLFNVTDEDGWVDIGMDGAVGLRMWYDGNVTPEISFVEQTNGSNHRIELRYEDIADPGNATLDEWSVTEGSATYEASASSLSEIYNGPTLIGYEFDLTLKLGLQVKATPDPTDSTPGGYNDPDSWNVGLEAFDGGITTVLRTVPTGEHLEFGVFARPLMAYAATPNNTTIQPAQTTVFEVDLDNAGQGNAETVWVNVSLPGELTYVGDDAGSIGGVGSCCYSFEFANVTPGSHTFSITVSANGGTPNETVAITNFTFESLDTLGRPVNQTAQDVGVTIVDGGPAFAPALIVDRSTAERGDIVTATLFYNNTGSGPALVAWANWSLNGHYELVDLTPPVLFAPSANGFDVTLPNVGPGDHALVARLRVIRGMSDGLLMDLQVGWEATNVNGTSYGGTTMQAEVTLSAPAASLSLSASESRIEVGSVFALNVTIRNTGGAVAVGWLNLTPPRGLEYVTHTGPLLATQGPGLITWEVSALPAGTAIGFEILFQGPENPGVETLRLSLAYTDQRGSPPETVLSNQVFLEFLGSPGLLGGGFPWWLLLLLAAAGATMAYLLTRRFRSGPDIEEVFVVHQRGVLIAHRSKTLTPDKDEDVLAAMLSAVQSFIQDAFNQHEDTPVRGLQFDKFNILVEQGTHHYVAVVFRGRDNGSLQARLHELSQRIEVEFGEILAQWQGDTTEVRPVKALLPLLWGKRKVRHEKRERPEAPRVEVVTETSVDDPGDTPEVAPEEATSDHPGGSDLEESGGDVSPVEARPEITKSGVQRARKAQLQAWCLELGLDDKGKVAELRHRLLQEIEGPEAVAEEDPEAI